MLCVDVNVLVDAFRPDAPSHEPVRAWLDAARNDSEPIALLPDVAAAFVRICTNRRIWRIPSPTADTLHFVSALAASPAVAWHRPGPRQWDLFMALVVDLNLSGDDVPDAYLAASALDLGSTLVTSDRGFTRFRALQVRWPRADGLP